MTLIKKNVLILLALIIGFTSCEKVDEVSLDSEIVLSSQSIQVSSEGGINSFEYSINNKIEGEELVVESNETWINNIKVEDKKISFNVDKNEKSDSRKAKLTLKYSNEIKVFKITQESGLDFGNADFHVEIVDLQETTIDLIVTPKDENLTYVTMGLSVADYEKIGDDSDVVKELISYFQKYADAYGQTLEEFLTESEMVATGKKNDKLIDLKPSTDYFFLVLGLSLKGEQLTSLHKEPFTTTGAEQIDFKLQITTKVDGPNVDIDIVSPDHEQGYYYDYMTKEQYFSANSTTASIIQENVDFLIKYYQDFGASEEEALAAILSFGDVSDKAELKGKTGYFIYASAINNEGKVCSEPVLMEFTTGDTPKSDNKIELNIKTEKPHGVVVDIATTNNDPYVTVAVLSSELIDKTDNDIVTYVNDKFVLSNRVLNGPRNAYEIEALQPNSEYTLVAFGYVGGVSNTDLVKKEFRTKKETQSDIKISIKYSKYFDVDALVDAYPGAYDPLADQGLYCLPMEVVVDKTAAKTYHAVLEDNLLDEETYDDNMIINNLINLGTGKTEAKKYWFLPYNSDLTIVAVAEDAEGNYSKVYREHINKNKEGVSPITEFEPESAPGLFPRFSVLKSEY